MEIITKSEKETQEFAKNFAQSLSFGDIVALKGNLGSGKTAFVKGLAKGLRIKDIITSPTFVFAKEYPIKKCQNLNVKCQKYGARNSFLIHIDCYRVKNEKDAEAIGLIDYLRQKDNIIAIEWPENISQILPKNIIRINFENLGKNSRQIIIN